jgi:hypothetical protein
LKQLGVAAGDVEHPQFGKSEDMLKELEKTRCGLRPGRGLGVGSVWSGKGRRQAAQSRRGGSSRRCG